MIQAKPKGEGLQPNDREPADRSNVIDLIAALKKSLASDKGRRPRAACQGRSAVGSEKARSCARPAAKKSAAAGAPKKPTRKRD